MTKRRTNPESGDIIDDVRRIRASIAAQYGGDLKAHVEDTNRIVEPIIKKLGLRRSGLRPAQPAGKRPRP